MQQENQNIFPIIAKKHLSKELVLEGISNSFEPEKELVTLRDSGWEKAKTSMQSKGWAFYDGPLLRFEGIEETSAKTVINISSAITYKDVVGIRAHREKTYSHLSQSQRPNALSTINIIITSDNIILMGLRASGDWNESYELSGGFMRTQEQHPNESTFKRLMDDFNIEEDEVVDHSLFAFAHFPSILETMFMYKIHTSLSSRDLTQRTTRYEKTAHIPHSFFGYQEFKKTLTEETPLHFPSNAVLDLYFSNSTVV